MRDGTFSVELGRRESATLAPYLLLPVEPRFPTTPKSPLYLSSPLFPPQEMPPLPAARSNLLRLCPRQHVPSTITLSILAATQQRRCKADVVERHSGEYEKTPPFQSPFKSRHENPTTKIPSFANYMSKKGETSNKTFQYFMVGGMGLLAAAGAKATVQGEDSQQFWGCFGRCYGVGWESGRAQWLTVFLEYRFPCQHVRIRGRTRASEGRDRPGCYTRGQKRMLYPPPPPPPPLGFAMRRIDVVGNQQVIIKWRGKPVFIRHRTADEIKEAEDTKWESLRDPQPDSDRVKKPEWLIMLGTAPTPFPRFSTTIYISPFLPSDRKAAS